VVPEFLLPLMKQGISISRATHKGDRSEIGGGDWGSYLDRYLKVNDGVFTQNERRIACARRLAAEQKRGRSVRRSTHNKKLVNKPKLDFGQIPNWTDDLAKPRSEANDSQPKPQNGTRPDRKRPTLCRGNHQHHI
jgi:hypothetical protein